MNIPTLLIATFTQLTVALILEAWLLGTPVRKARRGRRAPGAHRSGDVLWPWSIPVFAADRDDMVAGLPLPEAAVVSQLPRHEHGSIHGDDDAGWSAWTRSVRREASMPAPAEGQPV